MRERARFTAACRDTPQCLVRRKNDGVVVAPACATLRKDVPHLADSLWLPTPDRDLIDRVLSKEAEPSAVGRKERPDARRCNLLRFEFSDRPQVQPRLVRPPAGSTKRDPLAVGRNGEDRIGRSWQDLHPRWRLKLEAL